MLSPDELKAVAFGVFLTDPTGREHLVRMPRVDGATGALMHELLRVAEVPWNRNGRERLTKTEFWAKRCIVIAARAVFGAEWKTSRRAEFYEAINGCVEIVRATDAETSRLIAEYANDSDAPRVDYPRLWELLRFILGRRLREQVFEPAYNDLLADHLTTRAARFQTPWARRWIKTCFFARTVWLVGQCAAVGLRGTAAAVLIPRWLREWLRL